MWTDPRMQELLGSDLPIIQAPMSGSSTLKMALAVSRAGGLGSLACAGMSAAEVTKLALAFSERSAGPVNLNFFSHLPPKRNPERESAWRLGLRPYFDELGGEVPPDLDIRLDGFGDALCRAVEGIAPKVVSFHFGLPSAPLLERLKRVGVGILCTATTVREARWLVDRGCDAVIAQGSDAGGHRGCFLDLSSAAQIGTLSLVPQVVDAVEVPVIAAGGIADARSVAAALALGASAVQVGTAYLFTHEASVSPAYRQAVQSRSLDNTVVTEVFSGRPARCIRNRLTDALGPSESMAPDFPLPLRASSALRSLAESNDNAELSAHYCGQAAGLARELGAEELTTELMHGCAALLQRLSSDNSAD